MIGELDSLLSHTLSLPEWWSARDAEIYTQLNFWNVRLEVERTGGANDRACMWLIRCHTKFCR